MTETRKNELQQKLDEAYSSGDASAIEAVRRTIDRETLECTAHTAARIKRIEADVADTKNIVYELRDDIRDERSQRKGAKALWEFLKIIVSAGGGMALIKALGG